MKLGCLLCLLNGYNSCFEEGPGFESLLPEMIMYFALDSHWIKTKNNPESRDWNAGLSSLGEWFIHCLKRCVLFHLLSWLHESFVVACPIAQLQQDEWECLSLVCSTDSIRPGEL